MALRRGRGDRADTPRSGGRIYMPGDPARAANREAARANWGRTVQVREPITRWLAADIGTVADRTASATIEPAPDGQDGWAVRHLARLDAGVTFEYAARQLVNMVAASGSETTGLVVDATGAGAFVELLARVGRDRLGPDRLRLWAVVFTGGAAPQWDVDRFAGFAQATLYLPKSVALMDAATEIQRGSVRIAAQLPLAALARQELEGFRPATTRTGRLTGEADTKLTAHDDLVTALGIAVSFAVRDVPGASSATRRSPNPRRRLDAARRPVGMLRMGPTHAPVGWDGRDFVHPSSTRLGGSWADAVGGGMALSATDQIGQLPAAMPVVDAPVGVPVAQQLAHRAAVVESGAAVDRARRRG